MPVKDLGNKHTCWKCGAKFYDLKKPNPSCPKCGSDPRQAPQRPTAAERRRPAKDPEPEEVAETIEEADLDEELEDEEAAEEEDEG